MPIESVMPSNYLILCCLSLLLPSIFPSIRDFSSESALGGQSTRASASVLAMNIEGWFPLGLTGLISFLSSGLSKSLLQHHNLKVSVLQCSAFFMVQLLHPYMTPRKTRALTVCAVGTRSGKQTQKDNAHSGVQFITPAGPRQSLLLVKDPNQFFCENLIYPKHTCPNPTPQIPWN